MLNELKKVIEESFKGTIWASAVEAVDDMKQKNKKLLPSVCIVVFLLSVLVTSNIILGLMNIGNGMYRRTLSNMIIVWFRYGIIPSVILFILLLLGIFHFYCIIQRNYIMDDNNVAYAKNNNAYGSARWMTQEVLEETFNIGEISEIKDTIFGRLPSNPNEVVAQKHPLLKLNRNTFMVAGPSAGKSATFVIPLILQILRRGESAIISDPKSELFMITSQIAKILGYEVRIMNLNPMFLSNSDPCNFMAYVGEDVDKAMVMSTAIISNTTGGDKLFDFWTEGPKNLLQAIILRINCSDDYKKDEKNLPTVYKYIMENSGEEIETDFDTNIGKDHPAYAPFMIYKDGEQKVKEQVLQGLRMKLSLFNSKTLRRVLSETAGGIDFLNPGRKKCLYFVGSNDQDSSMAPIISLFYTLMYQELVRYADSRNPQELPVTVHMILDEYANMGTIPDFEKKLSTVRSRGIVTYIIVQDINQLATKHPNETWRTVINDCDYYLMLKTSDENTMTWWSNLSGEGTTVVVNKMFENARTNITGIHNLERNTEGLGTKQIVTKGEARKIKNDEVQLCVSGRDFTKLKTFFWKTDHPYGKLITKNAENMYVLPVQHIPFYKLIEMGLVDETYDYDHELDFIMEIPPDEEIEIDEDYNPDEMLGYAKGAKEEKKKNIVNTKKEILAHLKREKKNAEKTKDPVVNRVLRKAGISESSNIYKFTDKLKARKLVPHSGSTPSYVAHPLKMVHLDNSVTCGNALLRAAGSEEMVDYHFEVGRAKKTGRQTGKTTDAGSKKQGQEASKAASPADEAAAYAPAGKAAENGSGQQKNSGTGSGPIRNWEDFRKQDEARVKAKREKEVMKGFEDAFSDDDEEEDEPASGELNGANEPDETYEGNVEDSDSQDELEGDPEDNDELDETPEELRSEFDDTDDELDDDPDGETEEEESGGEPDADDEFGDESDYEEEDEEYSDSDLF